MLAGSNKTLEIDPKKIRCKPLKPVQPLSGRVFLKPRTKHPALVALAHFANVLQKLGYPFAAKDRTLYNNAQEALGLRKGVMICPHCAEQARFLPIDNTGKMKAWFCACTYETHHMNGCRRGD